MDSFISHLKADWVSRPRWMNPIFYFCLYMAFVYMPFDFFFKPLATDHEIWFGVALTGWWAKATEPVHWLIYAAGAYGFWKMKAWMWPWAAVYVARRRCRHSSPVRCADGCFMAGENLIPDWFWRPRGVVESRSELSFECKLWIGRGFVAAGLAHYSADPEQRGMLSVPKIRRQFDDGKPQNSS
jgi:hypothetical protein